MKTKLEDINKEELKFINGGTVKDSKKKDITLKKGDYYTNENGMLVHN